MKKEKELNFSFPIVRDIERTRALHLKRIGKLEGYGMLSISHITGKGNLRFLGGMSDDDMFESIIYEHRPSLYYYPIDNWKGQKGVKAIKSLVNSRFRQRIINYLIECGLPESWNTAYYLLHQSQIDARMEAVSKLIYAELT